MGFGFLESIKKSVNKPRNYVIILIVMPPKLQLKGKRFKRLLVLGESAGHEVGKKVSWDCLCDCGNVKSVQGSHLVRNKIMSCGCYHKDVVKNSVVDRVGRRYGRLLVIARAQNRVGMANKIAWECRCDCGKVKTISALRLTLGTISCGCFRSETTAKLKYSHGKAGTPAYQKAASMKRHSAKLRRTPKWSDLEAIQRVYEQCPAGCQVDHIIPLQGELVSGLHVPANLQYLTKSENVKKNNLFKPQIIPANRPNELPGVYWGK